MTVDGPDERPLALRDLAETESPEMVRAALGRFRRRLLVRGLILILAIAAGLVLYPRYFTVQGDLIHDIQHAHGVERFDLVVTGPLKTSIRRVGRLKPEDVGPRPERYGIHAVIYNLSLAQNERLVVNLFPEPGDLFSGDQGGPIVEVATGTGAPVFPAVDLWVTVTTGTRSIDVPVEVVTLGASGSVAHRSLETIHLDMRQLKIPDWIWR